MYFTNSRLELSRTILLLLKSATRTQLLWSTTKREGWLSCPNPCPHFSPYDLSTCPALSIKHTLCEDSLVCETRNWSFWICIAYTGPAMSGGKEICLCNFPVDEYSNSLFTLLHVTRMSPRVVADMVFSELLSGTAQLDMDCLGSNWTRYITSLKSVTNNTFLAVVMSQGLRSPFKKTHVSKANVSEL